MRQVKDHLVVGVGVDGGHHAVLDTKSFVYDFGHRRQAVGSAGSIGNDVVLGCIVFTFIDAHDNGDVFALGRSRNDDFFGAGFDMGGRFIRVSETPGRLDDYVDAESAPWQG